MAITAKYVMQRIIYLGTEEVERAVLEYLERHYTTGTIEEGERAFISAGGGAATVTFQRSQNVALVTKGE